MTFPLHARIGAYLLFCAESGEGHQFESGRAHLLYRGIAQIPHEGFLSSLSQRLGSVPGRAHISHK